MSQTATKFLVISEFGEICDLAAHLKHVEKQEVLLHIPDHNYKKIGDGIVEKVDDSLIQQGKGYIWVFDGCSRGKRQDFLRSRGELVVGGTAASDKLENDRQAGQVLFKQAGFKQAFSQNFKSIEDAMTFVRSHNDKRYILKQNGDAPKSMNHMAKFADNVDLLFHLEELKRKWSPDMGPVEFDLMEVVEGLEVAVSAFFNGREFLKNSKGKVVGFLNFEEKKEIDGGLGETTGELGTTFVGVDEDNALFKDIMLRPLIAETLRTINYRGVFDINCIKTKDGIVALEPTSRFGIPATSYEFMEGLITPTHELLTIMAKGESKPVEIHMGVGMVMVVAAKPFPLEGHTEESSLGEKLWILKDGKPIDDFTADQRKHIHLENFEKTKEGYRVASSNGYLLTVTGRGKTISEARDSLIKYIKDNLYISGMKYRSDIGVRVEETAGTARTVEMKMKLLEAEFEKKKEELVQDSRSEMTELKSALKKAIYG